MTTHRSILPALAVLVFTYATHAIQASEPNWPQFRGPNCSGLAGPGENPPVTFAPAENVQWKTPLPPGHSSPCIWGDRIFLTGFDQEKKELRVFCLDRTSGRITWSRIVPCEQIEKAHSISSPATATPATDGERVYLYFGSAGLLAYDFDGNKVWTVSLPMPETRFGSGTSPIVTGELVILNRDEHKDSYLLAVDRRSGQTVWKHTHDPAQSFATYATPVLWQDQIVIHRRESIIGHALQDGAPIWWINAPTSAENTPVVGGDMLFVARWSNFGEPDQVKPWPDFQNLVKQYDKNGDHQINKEEFPTDLEMSSRPEVEKEIDQAQFYLPPGAFNAFDKDKDGLLDEVVWEEYVAMRTDPKTLQEMKHGLTAIKAGGEKNITATHVLWQEKTHVPEVPSPIYYENRVYMIKNGGIVSCMDAATGKLLYRERLGAPGLYCSSPICANGRLYIASSKGVVTVFDAGDRLRVLARNDLKEPVYATPAIVDNTLYVRTVQYLYAFGKTSHGELRGRGTAGE